jgi:hypothetical protein
MFDKFEDASETLRLVLGTQSRTNRSRPAGGKGE